LRRFTTLEYGAATPRRFGSGTMTGDHGWQGRGRFRVGQVNGQLVLRFAGVSTRSSRLSDEIGSFFRKEYRGRRPGFQPFGVHIWIETSGQRRRLDADNVAKACLDALTGLMWKDDSQVVRLTVEKVPAEAEAITIAVSPTSAPTSSADLDRLLDDLAKLSTPAAAMETSR